MHGIDQAGPDGGDGLFDEGVGAAAPSLAQDRCQFLIVRREGISRENDTVLEKNGNLEIVAGH